MATCSVSAPSNGVMPVSGASHSGSRALLAVAFTATNNRRRSLETYIAPIAAGNISADVPIAFTGGTVVVKVADPVTGTVAATSSGQAV